MGSLRAASRSLIIPLLALGASACSGPPAGSSPGDRTLNLGAEAASFYLFHPDDLQHRKASPSEWVLYEFALAPEFAAGNLVTFSTGADGTYRLRLTQGDLTAREKKSYSCSWDFRYRVRHGRVLVDSGEFIPADRVSDLEGLPPGVSVGGGPIPEGQWFAITNGDYKVTVNAIDARSSGLPDYVIQFKPVERLDAIKAATCPPRLEPGPNAKPQFYPVSVDGPNEEPAEEPLPESCPVIVAPTLTVVPGLETERITVSEAEIARSPSSRDDPPEFERAVALVDSEQVPRLGGLCSVSAGMQQDGGKWSVALRVRRLVNVTAIMKHEGRLRGTITEFHRPRSEVVPKDVTAVKSAFAAYAQSNQAYRTKVMHPDYEAERLSAIDSPAFLSNVLLHHVQMPPATRARLLPLSDAERITELLAILKPPVHE
jgi:hypothetical protein